MSLAAYKKTMFSWQALRKIVSSFFQAFGFLALILGVLDILFPNAFHFGYQGIIAITAFSLLWSGFLALIPRYEISRQLPVPDTKITIKAGDLFQEDANVVVGMNDVFDTEKGDIIKPTSIQGQFLTKIYHDDRIRLDQDIDHALQGIACTQDSQKTKGKSQRYPIGTVATVSVGTRKYFCSAYSRMGNNLKVESDIQRLSSSLDKLWEEIRVKGQHDKVAMPVVGSGLARIGNASHADLIKLIVLSFVLASREKLVAPELVIVIDRNNLEKVNMLELKDFLRSF